MGGQPQYPKPLTWEEMENYVDKASKEEKRKSQND